MAEAGVLYFLNYRKAYEIAKTERNFTEDFHCHEFAQELMPLGGQYIKDYREAYILARDVRKLPDDLSRDEFARKKAEAKETEP